MGRRSRQDPAGHQQRGKGRPTAPVSGNADEVDPPGPTLVFFPVGLQAGFGAHPVIEGATLDVRFDLPGGGAAICRMPAGAWAGVRDQIDALYEKGADDAEALTRAAQAGIHLPGGVDLEEEARGHEQIREGGTEDA